MLVVGLLDRVFGLGVDEDAGRLALAGAFSPFISVPGFLTVPRRFGRDFDAHKLWFVNIQLSAICPPE